MSNDVKICKVCRGCGYISTCDTNLTEECPGCDGTGKDD